jgi:hypothetical protein
MFSIKSSLLSEIFRKIAWKIKKFSRLQDVGPDPCPLWIRIRSKMIKFSVISHFCVLVGQLAIW